MFKIISNRFKQTYNLHVQADFVNFLPFNSWVSHLTLAEDCPATKTCEGTLCVCCDDSDLGCFDANPPYTGFPYPCCYDDTDATFSLYTRNNKANPVLIKRTNDLP